jgi:replicative DNA helicase
MKHFNFSENDLLLNYVPSGFTELDKITGGWLRGNLIMIAAPFRMGKTAFALSIMHNNLLLENSSVIWFSTFLSKNQFTRMFVSHYAEIKIEEINLGKIDQKLISEINEVFITHDFYFYDNPNLNTLAKKRGCG